MMWHPFKSAFRAGGAGPAGEFDEANIGFYSWAGGNRTIAKDFGSFAMGNEVTVSGDSAAGFGSRNTVGGHSGFVTGTNSDCNGFACVAMGSEAATDGQGAVALGHQTTADADHSYALSRMASTNGMLGSFVYGDASINDTVEATANNQFVVRARGGFRFRTSTAANDPIGTNDNTGCDLPGNSGSFQCASSRTLKEGFKPVDGEYVLDGVRVTPVTTWRYKGEEGEVLHMGPVAEDFHAAFGLGTDDTTIGTIDMDGVNFAANKALEERTAELRKENDGLEEKVETLEGENEALRAEQEETKERQDALDRRLDELEEKLEE